MAPHAIIETPTLDARQKEGVLRIWNQEYPEKLKHTSVAELENYLKELENQRHLLLINPSEEIMGWSCTFLRQGERWFAMLLDPATQGLGYGTFLLNKLKEKELKLCAWVIDGNREKKQNGEYYRSPMGFYLKNDFIISPGIRRETEKMSAVKIEWKK